MSTYTFMVPSMSVLIRYEARNVTTGPYKQNTKGRILCSSIQYHYVSEHYTSFNIQKDVATLETGTVPILCLGHLLSWVCYKRKIILIPGPGGPPPHFFTREQFLKHCVLTTR
jgi:hypothetical protein